MRPESVTDRRAFLGAAAVGMGVLLTRPAHAGQVVQKPAGQTADQKDEADISPPEDLMREHGVLKRILLIYEEAIRRIAAKQDLPPEALKDAAGIIRSFVEDYHEKLEEDFVFPRFEKAGKLVELTKVLRVQHQAGRRLTDVTLQLATAAALKNPDESRRLSESLRQFIRMYSPHEAREDTVLFPAFRSVVSAHEFDALGDDFEKKENELFGDEGFEKNVDKVAALEKQLGIYDLAQFTPA